MGRLTAIALLVFLPMAGCGGGASTPRLVDGSRPGPVPRALAHALSEDVLTRVRATTAGVIDPVRLRTCEKWSVRLAPTAVVVERTGLSGSSLAFVDPGEDDLYSCDSIPNLIPDRDRPDGSPWCASSAGRLIRHRLTDPRLGLCQTTKGALIAFVWIEPARGARWIVVHDGPRREIYPVAGSLPVRVTTTHGLRVGQDRATFDVEEYAADGRKIKAYKLEAAVAG